ncbi:MAG TPA: nicotinamide riboside transporter PnuC [Stellaceae bacterium]|nr:nicotinamide riboside transporter PnuC [Stellaceae bacterium]
MSPLEIVAVVVSFLAIWLTMRRHVLCWPVGLLSVILYAKIFFDAQLYSDTLLQGCFAVSILYGWIVWQRNKIESGEVVVADPSAAALGCGLICGAAGSLLLGFLMGRYTNAALPWLDAMLSSFSLVGQWWTARRYIANWWLWIAVDTVYVGMFLFKALYLTAGLYAAFTVLAVLGLRAWHGAAARHRQTAAAAPASG